MLKDLAVACVVVGRFPKARAILPEAISLWRELDNKPMVAEILGGQAAQHFSSGELNQAIRAGGESYALNQSIRNRFGLAITASFICLAVVEALLEVGTPSAGPAERSRSLREAVTHRRGFSQEPDLCPIG